MVAGQAVQVSQLLADLRAERLDRLLQAHHICKAPFLYACSTDTDLTLLSKKLLL